MSDYFGYDVHFVMNITDIDDKACLPLRGQHYHLISFCKIIRHSRQNYLFEKFASENGSLSNDLIAQLRTAWNAFFHQELVKKFHEAEKPRRGQEDVAWQRIVESLTDESRKAECIKRDVEFEMHFKAAVSSYLLSQMCSPGNGFIGRLGATRLFRPRQN
jgi:cysteinyl-tRNA synthetase